MASSRRSFENHWRILFRARGLRTKSSQSWLGPAPSTLDVKISTQSPGCSFEFSGHQPAVDAGTDARCPTSVWMA